MATQVKQEIPQDIHDLLGKLLTNYKPGDIELWGIIDPIQRTERYIEIWAKPTGDKSISIFNNQKEKPYIFQSQFWADGVFKLWIWIPEKKE